MYLINCDVDPTKSARSQIAWIAFRVNSDQDSRIFVTVKLDIINAKKLMDRTKTVVTNNIGLFRITSIPDNTRFKPHHIGNILPQTAIRDKEYFFPLTQCFFDNHFGIGAGTDHPSHFSDTCFDIGIGVDVGDRQNIFRL